MLAYDRSGSGPPLVLLHPLGADRRVWRPVIPGLTAQRDVIAVDLPGFGDSPALSGDDASPRALAAAVARFLADDLGLAAPPHVAGNSLGGWVALELALSGAAASVVAIAPAGLWERPLAPKPELARSVARALGPVAGAAMRVPSLRRAALAGSVGHPDRVPPRDAAALIDAYGSAPGFTAANRAMRAGTFGGLNAITVPVTLAWPERDRLIARPHAVPPRVRQVDLPGCGHIPMWDDPAAVAAVLLAGSEPDRAGGAGEVVRAER
ncbi:alpha/beta fold hydrolase [Conexibacter woesei]|uniref:alpha/beta fold hydrolase n=1 Tax=Conexibacter woesei TaxID=191495 RepID=UPI00042974C5|nr:alpha/beta fold hydrolase [Conexibacter woesei]